MNNKRLLLVEDDLPLARLFARVLEKHGYFVDCATDADHARALLAAHTYAVFLCDLTLHGERGLDLITEWKTILESHHTQIVVVSGNHRMRDICEAAGIEFFLSKPISTHELVQFVGRLISARGQELPSELSPNLPESTSLSMAARLTNTA